MKLQNLFLVALAFNQLSFSDYLSPEEYAAIKIQTAFRASQNKKQVQEDLLLKKFQDLYLNPIPYQEFRNLICSGNYLNRTDLLGHFVQMVRKETVEFPKEMISTEFKNRFDLNTIKLYKKACNINFESRAFHEIYSNTTNWTEAISMSERTIITNKRTPVTATYQNKCIPPRTYLVIGNIFTRLIDQRIKKIAMPILLAKKIKEKRYENESHTEMVGIISIFGNDYASPIDPNQDEASWVKTTIYKSLECYFNNYFEILGTPAHLKNQEVLDDQINWELVAQKVFYLGQFFFDNRTDALTALGGQRWIKQQPEDIQEIINTHLKNIQPQSWLSSMKKRLYQYADYAKKEAHYYLKK